MCLRVPFSYIRVAFGLLSDCIFDGGKGYWDRGNRRESACLMLYKFWCHQTGRGILTSSGISGWDKEYRHAMAWTVEGEARDRVEKINRLLKEHQKQLDEAISDIYIEKSKENKE